jgi:hypothetical protein
VTIAIRAVRSRLLRRRGRHRDDAQLELELGIVELGAGLDPIPGSQLEEPLARPVGQHTEQVAEVHLRVEVHAMSVSSTNRTALVGTETPNASGARCRSGQTRRGGASPIIGNAASAMTAQIYGAPIIVSTRTASTRTASTRTASTRTASTRTACRHQDREHQDREHQDREHQDREHQAREHQDRLPALARTASTRTASTRTASIRPQASELEIRFQGSSVRNLLPRGCHGPRCTRRAAGMSREPAAVQACVIIAGTRDGWSSRLAPAGFESPIRSTRPLPLGLALANS